MLKDKGNRSREVTPSAIEVTGLAAALTAAGRISPAAAAAFVAAAGGETPPSSAGDARATQPLTLTLTLTLALALTLTLTLALALTRPPPRTPHSWRPQLR